MKEKIKKAKRLAWNKYGVRATITFNLQGFELGIDEPIYYKAQARMIKDIKEIIGPFCLTELYVM